MARELAAWSVAIGVTLCWVVLCLVCTQAYQHRERNRHGRQTNRGDFI